MIHTKKYILKKKVYTAGVIYGGVKTSVTSSEIASIWLFSKLIDF